MHPAQNFAGCWVAGCTQLKISLGAGWLGAPSSKFCWVLGGWGHPARNLAGCWVAGCTQLRILLGAGWLGAPTQHPGPPWVPSWVDFSNTAFKAYSNAVKWENRNQLILKDLSHLQIQMRDYEAFKVISYQRSSRYFS